MKEIIETISRIKRQNGVILFDLDGTLMNTEPLHAKAVIDELHHLNIKDELEKIAEEFIGIPDGVVFSELQRRGIFPKGLSLNSFLKEKNLAIHKIAAQISDEDFFRYLTPGIEDFLKHPLIKDIKKVVVSASESAVVTTLLSKRSLDKNFLATFSRESTFRSKPSPSPYFLALRELRLTTDKVLIFEDSPTGTEAAIATNATVVRITTNLPSKMKIGADQKKLTHIHDFTLLCNSL